MLNPTVTFGDALDDPGARRVLKSYLSNYVSSPSVEQLRELLLSQFLSVTPSLRDDAAQRDRFWADMEGAMATTASLCRAGTADADGAAQPAAGLHPSSWSLDGKPSRWGVLQVSLHGPSEGNPFVDVELSAEFTCGSRTWVVGGFYDGGGVYRLRVLAEEEGVWTFHTHSNAPSLDGVQGEVTVAPAQSGSHGPVRAEGFHFSHADGTRFRPWGTTAYAWIHQPRPMQQQTLETLSDSRFNKLRMCLFPKHFLYNTDEPQRFPFARRSDGSFDVERFDLHFFKELDDQICALAALGVEADVILFHPYDRWGFSDLGPTADDRWVRYVVRRLAGYPNIWWSMANEYDLLVTKSQADWDRLGRLVKSEDPHDHPVSIHNWVEFFDHGRDWVTHASIQRGDVENTDAWRTAWGKPVVVDECAYEGDLEYTWGAITGQEMVRRFWEGAVRGGYVGHGETYYAANHHIWWARGGQLVGTSHDRIGFLDDVAAGAPGGVLEPIPVSFDGPWAGTRDRYLVTYFGIHQPRERHVLLAPGQWVVDVLDTWECTVRRLPGTHRDFVLVPLPARPYIALRLIAVEG